MKSILILLTTSFALCFPETNKDITGRWRAVIRENIHATLHYKKDSTFDVFINNKVFVTGRYTYNGDTLTFVEDNGCQDKDGGQLRGAYSIRFFHSDSIQCELIYDSCSRRRKDLNHLKLGKVEKSFSE
jgi:hypothetical protein